jgi:beta-lactamase class A
MSLGGLGARDSGGIRLPILGLLSGGMVLVGLILFGQQLIAYSNQSGGSLQADVTIAGVQVGGMSESSAQRLWEQVYLDQPITLIYRGSPMIFSPRTLGFQTNNEVMLAEARSESAIDQNFWGGFWAFLWDRAPDAVHVPLDASVQEGALRSVLDDIAARYDSDAQDIGFDPATLSFQSGASGSRLDVDRSVTLIREVLFKPNPDERVVELPTVGVAGGDASMEDLRQAVLSYMESRSFLPDADTTIGSVFVMNLNTGEEMSILGDVAQSAVSTIKIGIMINYFRYQVTAPDPDTAYLLASAIICSHNPGANFVMQTTSDSHQDIIQGLFRTSETMLQLGAINSWITSPLYVGDDGNYPVIERPARPNLPNQNYNAQPDNLNTTTAEDMGTMLAMIYDCAFNNGGLRAVFPEQITQTECQQMLELLSGVKFSRFSELGTPEGTRISHKVGYGAETVGDAAIVFSPNADYIFVMYIWEEDLDYDFLTELDKWNLIDETSRLVYNYFNPETALMQARTPVNALGGAGCVLPRTSEEVNLNNISENRFDENGIPLASACYDWPLCLPFDNWGQGESVEAVSPSPEQSAPLQPSVGSGASSGNTGTAGGTEGTGTTEGTTTEGTTGTEGQ